MSRLFNKTRSSIILHLPATPRPPLPLSWKMRRHTLQSCSKVCAPSKNSLLVDVFYTLSGVKHFPLFHSTLQSRKPRYRSQQFLSDVIIYDVYAKVRHCMQCCDQSVTSYNPQTGLYRLDPRWHYFIFPLKKKSPSTRRWFLWKTP